MAKALSFAICISLIALAALLIAPPRWLFTFAVSPVLCPGAVYAVNTSEPVVALTIDDGPDLRQGKNNSTTRILDILQRHNQQASLTAHATFFLISDALKMREQQNGDRLDPVTARIIAEGHEIGNHMTQDRASILLERFEQEFDRAHQQLLPYTQLPGSHYREVRWFRPGVGWCDYAMIDTVSNYHFAQTDNYPYRSRPGLTNIALGSIWSYDTILGWSQFSQAFIQNNLKPGAIIVLHDGEDRGDRTAQVLEGVLQDLKTTRYKIVSLSELLTLGEPIATQEFPGFIEAIRKFLVVWFEGIRLRLF